MTHKDAGMRHAHTCAAQRQKGIALFIVVMAIVKKSLKRYTHHDDDKD